MVSQKNRDGCDEAQVVTITGSGDNPTHKYRLGHK